MRIAAALEWAAVSVPKGRWAIAVSGGADSVALLQLLHRSRPDLDLHVVHLDHETRSEQSTGDATFVKDLSRELGLPCTIKRISEIHLASPPTNRSAYFRAARLELFHLVVNHEKLQGVLLAHHADDQAETVLHRLLRGSSSSGLTGMRSRTRVQGVTILRPLLKVRRQRLRDFLSEIQQTWREDASNASPKYFRNRLRMLLARLPCPTDHLTGVACAMTELRHWIRAISPPLSETFEVGALADLPPLFARESARQWLAARGCPRGELSPAVLDRLILLAADAASPNRMQFPGALFINRKAGRISSS